MTFILYTIAALIAAVNLFFVGAVLFDLIQARRETRSWRELVCDPVYEDE